jgi:putative ABC transport system permease protein
VLAVLGGALGILLAFGIIDAITAVMPPVGTMLPSEAEIRISVSVLLFTIATTTLAGLLFGAAPAWQATRLDLNEVLKLGGRTGSGGVRRKALRLLVTRVDTPRHRRSRVTRLLEPDANRSRDQYR